MTSVVSTTQRATINQASKLTLAIFLQLLVAVGFMFAVLAGVISIQNSMAPPVPGQPAGVLVTIGLLTTMVGSGMLGARVAHLLVGPLVRKLNLIPSPVVDSHLKGSTVTYG